MTRSVTVALHGAVVCVLMTDIDSKVSNCRPFELAI